MKACIPRLVVTFATSLILLVLLLVASSPVNAAPGEPYLVKDIDTRGLSSNSRDFVDVNGILYFIATDENGSPALVKSDGTLAGTTVITNVRLPFNQGGITQLTDVNGMLFFVQAGFQGPELWKSDGTPNGTVRVKEFKPAVLGPFTEPSFLTNVNGTLFFRAGYEATGAELWKSDGTEAGTVLVREIISGTTSGIENNFGSPFFAFGNTLFFFANDTVTGRELWKSDGTGNGTVLVKDINPGEGGSNPNGFIVVNGTLYFRASSGNNHAELWKSDGSSNGTVKVWESTNPYQFPSYLTNFNDQLYILLNGGLRANSAFIRFDATTNSTVVIREFPLTSTPSSGQGRSELSQPIRVGNSLYFFVVGLNGGLWKSDGTNEGTLLTEVNLDSASRYVVANGLLYYFRSNPFDGSDIQLWRTDGTVEGTFRAKGFRHGTFGLNTFGTDERLFFTVYDPQLGLELWKSDGSETGTTLVKDMYPATESAQLALTPSPGPNLYFQNTRSGNSPELWRSNGTLSGTVMLSSAVSSLLARSDGQVIFSGYLYAPSYNYGLWQSDGTTSGITLLKLFPQTNVPPPQLFTEVAGTIFFVASDSQGNRELWKSDGTPSGTQMVKDIFPGEAFPGSQNGSDPYYLTKVGGTLFFIANDGEHGGELWKSDGTSAGTILVKDIVTGTGYSGIDQLAVMSDTLYFTANDNGKGLWKTDGTEVGTTLVKRLDIPSSSGNDRNLLVKMGGVLYFVANSETTGSELWKSDGTEVGTVLVKDINSGSQSSFPILLTDVDGTLYFQAYTSSQGRELWKSNGTDAGTVLVKDITPGQGNSFFSQLFNVNGTLYMGGQPNISGLWKSDGSEAGTVLIKKFGFTQQDSGPTQLTLVNNTLYFVANDNLHGKELWALDLTIPLPENDANVTVQPNASATLTYTASDGCGITLDVPSGAVIQTITLLYNEVISPSQLISTGLQFAGCALSLDAFVDGNAQDNFTFQQPVTLTISYSDADVVGLDESQLSLWYFDTVGGTWSQAGVTIVERDAAINRIVARIEHLTQFAIAAPTAIPPLRTVYLPVVRR